MAKKNSTSHVNKQVRALEEELAAANKKRRRFLILAVSVLVVFILMFIFAQLTIQMGIDLGNHPALVWTVLITLIGSAIFSTICGSRFMRYKSECNHCKDQLDYIAMLKAEAKK